MVCLVTLLLLDRSLLCNLAHHIQSIDYTAAAKFNNYTGTNMYVTGQDQVHAHALPVVHASS